MHIAPVSRSEGLVFESHFLAHCFENSRIVFYQSLAVTECGVIKRGGGVTFVGDVWGVTNKSVWGGGGDERSVGGQTCGWKKYGW